MPIDIDEHTWMGFTSEYIQVGNPEDLVLIPIEKAPEVAAYALYVYQCFLATKSGATK